jgi:hypothetical protein
MSNTISLQTLTEALGNAGIDYNAVNDDEYSGRGMNGATCLSFVIDGKRGIQRDLCQLFVWLTRQADDMDYLGNMDGTDADVSLLARDVCTDDLGMDMIVYFPGWKLA